MAAVVRVKRSLSEEPNGALILSCKRRKTDISNDNAVETLFKFVGTVKDQKENVALLRPGKLSKEDVKSSSRPTPNISQKSRSDVKASSQSNRYKLVNYFRAMRNVEQSDCVEDGESCNSITVLDVEAHPPENQVSTELKEECACEKSAPQQYVYDLYYIQSDDKEIDVDDLLLDGLVSFAPVENELVFDTYRNNRAAGGDSDSDSPLMDDDDDSNDENNWRNDYPDEEEANSDDDGLASGFERVRFGDEELSSDEGDERLIYTEELSPSDVNMFGSAYANFKKRALREVDSLQEINSDSDDSDSDKSVCSGNDDD